jgi:hypothetical protein
MLTPRFIKFLNFHSLVFSFLHHLGCIFGENKLACLKLSNRPDLIWEIGALPNGACSAPSHHFFALSAIPQIYF